MRYASDNFYVKSADEMHALFPEDHQALENTLAIAERCNLVIPTGTFHLPRVPGAGGLHASTLTSRRWPARAWRSGWSSCGGAAPRGSVKTPEELYRQRLDYEIEVIQKMGFPGYFLVVWDFIRYARENKTSRWGRGAARRRARWSPTRCASPTSTRCSTTCCSSAS